jgi:hypothetical protein
MQFLHTVTSLLFLQRVTPAEVCTASPACNCITTFFMQQTSCYFQRL